VPTVIAPVEGSTHGALGGARRGAGEGLSNRGDGLRNSGARLPRDRLLTCPRLCARTFGVLRAGPLGADLLRRSRRSPLASGLLRCGRLRRLGLEGRARALDVLPREPAAPPFSFGLRVGMAISSCAGWSAFVTASSQRALGRAAPRLSSPLLTTLQGRHLPRTVPDVFGRRARLAPPGLIHDTRAPATTSATTSTPRRPAAPASRRLVPTTTSTRLR
jgi:hypothetical protein